ncbi:MAG TPA: heavy-metal-associated domain-containing protein [Fimbriimonas sp.]|nr:heavy-metal-associated domain-containing protein [Fimbriimonas sp.]
MVFAVVFASLSLAVQAQQPFEPVTFSVSGFSCVSCARTVQKKLSEVAELRDVVVTLPDHRARMRIDPNVTSLQSITGVIAGPSGKFIPRLLLKLDERATFPQVKQTLEAVAGVRYVREPNDQGLMLIDLRAGEKTTLNQIYQAAKRAGLKVADAPFSKPN